MGTAISRDGRFLMPITGPRALEFMQNLNNYVSLCSPVDNGDGLTDIRPIGSRGGTNQSRSERGRVFSSLIAFST